MSALFKNSLLSLSGMFLIAGFILRIYLNNAAIVPAWIPPPVCPCWDSNTYQCLPNSICKGMFTVIPTPTPYQEQIAVKPREVIISYLTFTPDCKVLIALNNNETPSFNLPNDRTISNTICPINTKYFLSPEGKIAVFENLSNPKNPAITIYVLSLNKVVTLENFNNNQLLDALFLPDSHLFILSNNKIKTYDLQSLIINYPSNIDFYQNKFKSISLESTEILLEPMQKPYATLKYSDNKIIVLAQDNTPLTDFNLILLYPRSSCPCWDIKNNICLPQSACLNREAP